MGLEALGYLAFGLSAVWTLFQSSSLSVTRTAHGAWVLDLDILRRSDMTQRVQDSIAANHVLHVL